MKAKIHVSACEQNYSNSSGIDVMILVMSSGLGPGDGLWGFSPATWDYARIIIMPKLRWLIVHKLLMII